MKIELTLHVFEGTPEEVAALAEAIRKLMPCDVEMSARITDDKKHLFDENVFALLGPLTTRTTNCLKNDNIAYVGELIQKSEAEMLRNPNFGQVGLHELKEKLASFGLGFNYRVKGWKPPEE